MGQNILSGNLLGLEINGHFVECELSCDFNFDSELLPASPVDSGGWKEFIQGDKSWSISLNAAMLIRQAGTSVNVILNAFLTGEIINIRYMVKNPNIPNFIISGKASVASGSISSAANINSSWTTSLTGNGPFTVEVNTNIIYLLATDDSGHTIIQDGSNKLIQDKNGN